MTIWLPGEKSTENLLTTCFNGLRRNCETEEWEDIDVACPGLAEPFRRRIKKIQQTEAREEALLYRPDGKVLVKKIRTSQGTA